MKDDVLWESSLLVVPNIVVPHNPEGFGIVCLEAAARGLPTVAARIEGLQDALEEGVTGMFFESGSDEDALRVTLQALETAWDTERMRAVIRERFFPELIASRYAHEIF
jgi:glycosyltransferase involved in cell wall biosynthesis